MGVNWSCRLGVKWAMFWQRNGDKLAQISTLIGSVDSGIINQGWRKGDLVIYAPHTHFRTISTFLSEYFHTTHLVHGNIHISDDCHPICDTHISINSVKALVSVKEYSKGQHFIHFNNIGAQNLAVLTCPQIIRNFSCGRTWFLTHFSKLDEFPAKPCQN